MVTEGELKSEFARKASDPWCRVDSAQSLFFAAQQMELRIHSMWHSIHESISKNEKPSDVVQTANYRAVYLMLIAFCMENLFKNSIAHQQKESIKRECLDTGRLPKQLKMHNLIVCTGACKIQRDELQTKLLRRLTKHAQRIGRYPFATSIPTADDLKPPQPPIDTGWSLQQAEAVKMPAENIAERLGVKLVGTRLRNWRRASAGCLMR